MDSVVNQKTKYKFLVVTINDGSPDRSREILRRYENLPNVKVIDQENTGFSGARNTGLRHIHAKYVMFVDSDDILLPNAIESLMDTALRHDADVVEGSYETLEGDKRQPCVTHTFAETDKWVGLFYGQPWAKVIKSSLFKHLCFPEGYWFEDTMMTMLLYPQCKKMMIIPDDVYLYRVNLNGISAKSRGNVKCLDSLYVTLQMLEDANRQNLVRDQQQYDHFFRQVRINQRRISTLRSSAVNHCVFNITCRAFNQYFHGMSVSDSKMKRMEYALQAHDFGLYMVECMI